MPNNVEPLVVFTVVKEIILPGGPASPNSPVPANPTTGQLWPRGDKS